MKFGLIVTLPRCNQTAYKTQNVKFGAWLTFGNELFISYLVPRIQADECIWIYYLYNLTSINFEWLILISVSEASCLCRLHHIFVAVSWDWVYSIENDRAKDIGQYLQRHLTPKVLFSFLIITDMGRQQQTKSLLNLHHAPLSQKHLTLQYPV
jgi:hypothetical protein